MYVDTVWRFKESSKSKQIVHQLLSLYGTGASAQALQKAFDENSEYMMPAQATHSSVLEELRADWKTAAPKYFSKGKHFSDFFAFFQEEIEKKGYEQVLLEYVFKGDEIAEVVYARLFAGECIMSTHVNEDIDETRHSSPNHPALVRS